MGRLHEPRDGTGRADNGLMVGATVTFGSWEETVIRVNRITVTTAIQKKTSRREE